MIAASEGFIGAARQLLERSASVSLEDARGRTALDLAVLNNRTRIADLIVERRA